MSARPSLDETWLQVAGVIAQRGTCSRLQVGAVLTRDGRVVATGWNGAPPGQDHCIHPVGSDARCSISIHAERNVIGFAARHGIATQGSTLYVTHSPCRDCASVLVAAGVGRVVFRDLYRDDWSGVNYLRAAWIPVDAWGLR